MRSRFQVFSGARNIFLPQKPAIFKRHPLMECHTSHHRYRVIVCARSLVLIDPPADNRSHYLHYDGTKKIQKTLKSERVVATEEIYKDNLCLG